MINRFALSFLCTELDRNEMYEVILGYIYYWWHQPFRGCLSNTRDTYPIASSITLRLGFYVASTTLSVHNNCFYFCGTFLGCGI